MPGRWRARAWAAAVRHVVQGGGRVRRRMRHIRLVGSSWSTGVRRQRRPSMRVAGGRTATRLYAGHAFANEVIETGIEQDHSER